MYCSIAPAASIRAGPSMSPRLMPSDAASSAVTLKVAYIPSSICLYVSSALRVPHRVIISAVSPIRGMVGFISSMVHQVAVAVCMRVARIATAFSLVVSSRVFSVVGSSLIVCVDYCLLRVNIFTFNFTCHA